MGIISKLRERLKPRLSNDVKADLGRAVQNLVASGLPIKEIRLFGSLDKGSWNGEKSDIDVAVLFSVDDVRYSCFNRVKVGEGFYEEGGTFPIYGETPEREALKKLVEGNPELKFKDKYELHIAIPYDLKRMWKKGAPLTGHLCWLGNQDMKPFIRNIYKGRVLYQA